uniref:Uncharacterized protein n=1 Tax=Arundo donax TaxID=35708 RepID=A0A0A9DWE7_ARUDO
MNKSLMSKITVSTYDVNYVLVSKIDLNILH